MQRLTPADVNVLMTDRHSLVNYLRGVDCLSLCELLCAMVVGNLDLF